MEVLICWCPETGTHFIDGQFRLDARHRRCGLGFPAKHFFDFFFVGLYERVCIIGNDYTDCVCLSWKNLRTHIAC